MINDYEFMLQDRIAKIQAINEHYDLEKNAYISFSGGKDSVVLSHLIDLALPNNNIPRLYLNTGIEYNDIVKFVKEIAEKDKRFIILNSGINIKEMLKEYGYPFKSKQHSANLDMYYRHRNDKEYIRSLQRYLGIVESTTKFRCPKSLLYQFTNEFKLHCSDKCCFKLKKEPAHKWALENNKSITLTGMRKSEGGQRASIGCIVTDKDNKLVKFHPLLVVSDEFEQEMIKNESLQLCKLYYPPFNFDRTGCKGCPFSLDLQEQLDKMEKLLPNEKKQCEMLWAPVYQEYRKIGYRLKDKPNPISIYDLERE